MPGSATWKPLLSDHRIGAARRAGENPGEVSRSEFHRDYDRIIFSSAFRRLSDKTQVVPFPKSDYTRQRLTHSLEVSCVGRSLATMIYDSVRKEIGTLVTQGDFEAIVAAACLAHDIGNPPFGHFGERAIQDWATSRLSHPIFRDLSVAERADLTRFEGNAQSFRVLCRLQMSERRGGMRLTAATLGALVKYPRGSVVEGNSRYRKHGYFQDDAELFHEVFQGIGRTELISGEYARHPLALLSEAADDICYAIVDLEDGCRAGLVPLARGLEILEGIKSGSTGGSRMPDAERLSMGRALAINELVQQCASEFGSHSESILCGDYTASLIDRCPAEAAYHEARRVSVDHIFSSERVLELESAGYRAIQGLLDILLSAAATDTPDSFGRHVRRLTHLRTGDGMTAYQRLLSCTDFVSGMTDRHCVELFRTLSGHAAW
ncbi:MAG: dNTP triphosphohydrolase [Planctomycetaceae bacterium]